MRLSLLFLLGTGLVASALGAPVTFVRIEPGYRTAASFQRISEFFTGRENTGGNTVRRTQPGERAGYYFFLRLKNGGPAVTDALFRLEVIAPTSPEPRTVEFHAGLPARGDTYLLGLTGSDWPDPDAVPVAWRLQVLAPDGTVLGTKQSFLWAPDSGASPATE